MTTSQRITDADTDPRHARGLFRDGLVAATSGWSHGYAQANLLVIPADWAFEFLLFAQRNPKPCPILDVGDIGDPTTVLAAGADVRTDIPQYRVWRDGELVDEPTDILSLWCDDLVAFYIGCSFTFESTLQDHGIPLRHLDQDIDIPLYVTRRQCRPAGRVHGPLVVSMRPIPADMVASAVELSGRMPDVHGSPVHVGAPGSLLAGDLGAPQFGDPVSLAAGDVPVFWACGVTPQAAIMASRVPFAITHAPGRMFITDKPDHAYSLGALRVD